MNGDWIKRGLIASGLTQLASRWKGTAIAILMYHSVMEEPERQASTLGGIIHSSDVFRGQMEVLTREYQPVTLDDVLRFLGGDKELPHRAVVVTFDDGYADNHDVALPILDQVGIPATFYITVGCVEKSKLPWPSRLRHALFTSRRGEWKHENLAALPLQDQQQRDRAFLTACDVCATLAGETQDAWVQRIEAELQAGPAPSAERLMMTWDQVRSLARRGHIVGSHTMTHSNLAYVGSSQARTELMESKRKLEAVLNAPVVHFAYPCPALIPHWNEETLEISREVGYETAVTTEGGRVRRHDNPLCLKRIRPTKTVDGMRWNLESTFLGRTI